jgi:uncharacterized protein YbbC (DUF1343 family)
VTIATATIITARPRAIPAIATRMSGFENLFSPLPLILPEINNSKFKLLMMLGDCKCRKNKMLLRAFGVLVVFALAFGACSFSQPADKKVLDEKGRDSVILTGADQTGDYIPFLKGKSVGLVANQTSVIGHTHLVDSLLSLGIKVKRVFGPEHGFRGNAEAGANISNYMDEQTGLPVISLYGSHKKPTSADLEGIEIMVFDIQDVGVRCYTYISTLTYVMESCAAAKIPLLVLDRPNPNGYYIDGPVLEPEQASFVGLHAVPLVYGLTIGEYASMANGEGWLGKDVKCDLTVIKLKNYAHSSRYNLPIKPSPNLSDMASVYLYPSLCLFEGTVISVGRGANMPFRVYGHPDLPDQGFSFKPISIPGVSDHPPCEGKICFGKDLSGDAGTIKQNGKIELSWLIESYSSLENKEPFFNDFFIKLAGTPQLRKQIEAGNNAAQINESWKEGLDKYRLMRKKYLLYPD